MYLCLPGVNIYTKYSILYISVTYGCYNRIWHINNLVILFSSTYNHFMYSYCYIKHAHLMVYHFQSLKFLGIDCFYTRTYNFIILFHIFLQFYCLFVCNIILSSTTIEHLCFGCWCCTCTGYNPNYNLYSQYAITIYVGNFSTHDVTIRSKV